jgi:hypothetical protein
MDVMDSTNFLSFAMTVLLAFSEFLTADAAISQSLLYSYLQNEKQKLRQSEASRYIRI